MATVLKTVEVKASAGSNPATSVFQTKTMNPEEVQAMIDQSVAKAIDKHNKTATIISACIGSVLLFFYAHGLLTVVDKVKLD